MRLDTRERILNCGGQIVHHKGFAATGLQEILTAAGVPKGSFYFYFKSKDDFGLALIDHYRQWLAEQVRPIVQDKRRPPLARLAGFFQWFEEYFAREGYIKGCPIGNLAQELADVNPAFREKLEATLANLVLLFARLLGEAQQQGALAADFDVNGTANFLVSAWQGALLRMKTVAGPEPLDNFTQTVFHRLLR